MNRPILRVYFLVVALFALLVVFTSRWTVFEAKGLRDNPRNQRALLESQQIRRGDIRAADGTLLAGVTPQSGGTYVRRYTPAARLFAHAIGYSYISTGRAGLEASHDGDLTGSRDAVTTLLDQLRGTRRQGDDLITTLSPKAQRAALAGLAGRPGAVVALDPRTGAVRALLSSPGFDPAQLDSPRKLQALNSAPSSPLFDRVTQAGYPPGSTFKVVTAIAAIDSGRFTPSSTLSGRNGLKVSGVPLNNDNNETFGDVDLTFALTKSINTVWAQVAVQLGKQRMARTMERLGFDAKAPIDLPRDQRAPSGEYLKGGLIAPQSSAVDVGRMGIGQDKLQVTPLQMAMVASAVADGGRLMQPYLVARTVDRDGRTVHRTSPHLLAQAMRPGTARQVGAMMTQVVKEGTGTAAALQGIDVAGKTGTAQIGSPGSNLTTPWFIAFAPANHPRVAIAVVLDKTQGGFGGTVAAPIAKSVMEALLR